ncbi:hypothetical protein ULMS_00140 [Patiriisocius marinistellae]|uniref:DUF4407 domain-containing protein n=1 Tax=Patiriisocius marinistellae TaxID=2494560 RepID=A0A5J4FWP2_9FLAO|nr:DUF4407 domain-containing protein [Patiriisocius marinistellae]GEQ84506.1 hypothetical protein ULMS_00140 [Patiriisocius marinistellae]
MLQRFFIFCSGADTDILKDCSAGENTKYAGIGATVFFTAVMAAIAGSFALYTVFDSVFTAIFFGLIWGLLIFNLDRFIVSTIKKRDNFFDELIQASPRIILALIIAIVISKPLEMKIFEKEINQVLLTEKNQMTLDNKDQLALQFTPNIDAKTSEILSLKEEIAKKEIAVNGLYDIYISEAEGTSGTNKLGKGPVYAEKRQKHDAALADFKILKEVNEAKISEAEKEIAQIKTDYETQVASTQPIINGFDGLMARINALNKLPWLPSFFIFLLFLAIETSPIIAKLLSPKGAYDYKLAEQEGTVQSWVAQQKAQRDILKTTDIEVNNRVYGDIAEEQAIYDYKRKIARKLMEEQADAFYKKQKSML